MIGLLILTTMLYYDAGINITPYIETIDTIPADCRIRIDIENRTNKYYDGYAYYSGRIKIYEGNMKSDNQRISVLKHEIGHLCKHNNRAGSYEAREINAG